MIRKLAEIPGLGPKRLKVLAATGIRSVDELLRWLPRRHLDRTRLIPFDELEPGEEATVQGEVVSVREIGGRMPRFTATLSYGKEELQLVFFHAIPLWRGKLREGKSVVASGKVGEFQGLQMVHPDLKILKQGEVYKGRILPVYPLSEELRSARIEQHFMRRIVDCVLESRDCRLQREFPHDLIPAFGLISEMENLRRLHHPESMDDVQAGFRQLRLQELIPVSVHMSLRRRLAAAHGMVRVLESASLSELWEQLFFEPTNGQRDCLKEIYTGLALPHQYRGLLQGDVGSGKTAVAQLAMVLCAQAGFQAVLMTPTEVLARQHFAKLEAFFAGLGLNCALLTGAVTGQERKNVLARLVSGDLQVVIGTHALFSRDVDYKALGLAVIDEQHRFGVEQRASLLGKGDYPDLLAMSATPIPRTLALTIYGDMEPVLLLEKPAGREPVSTRLVPRGRRADMLDFLAREVEGGNQVFWVVPRVEEDSGGIQSAEALYKELDASGRAWTMGLVHGRQDALVRRKTLSDFGEGKIGVLVATTVVEVGVDVPGAGIIVIDSPEHFGLAQLHQLRGRVGRGGGSSWCFLLLDENETARDRLDAFSKNDDGFEIAEMDLEQRGAGNLDGLAQSGEKVFRYFDFVKHRDLVEDVVGEVDRILDEDGIDAGALRRAYP